MSVKIRLTRLGDVHTPFYRIVVADSRVARDGKIIEAIGTYNPMTNPATINVDVELAKKWIANGATPTDTAKQLLVKSGIKFKASKAKTTKPTIAKAKKNSKKK